MELFLINKLKKEMNIEEFYEKYENERFNKDEVEFMTSKKLETIFNDNILFYTKKMFKRKIELNYYHNYLPNKTFNNYNFIDNESLLKIIDWQKFGKIINVLPEKFTGDPWVKCPP